MSKDDGGSAFPNTPTNAVGQCADHEWGMSLRDYFAAKAMQGLAGVNIYSIDCITKKAYKIADAMIAERSKP